MFALHTDDVIGVYLGLCSRGGAMPIVVDVCMCGSERKEERRSGRN